MPKTPKIEIKQQNGQQHFIVNNKRLLVFDELYGNYKIFDKGNKVALIYRRGSKKILVVLTLNQNVSLHIYLDKLPPVNSDEIKFEGKPKDKRNKIRFSRGWVD